MNGQGSPLPDTVREVIRTALASSELTGSRLDQVKGDLEAYFEDGLAAGHTAEELIERFGDPHAAGKHIAWAHEAPPPNPALTTNGGAARGFRWELILQEVRLSLRALGRAPAFTALVLITLALGVGANTAVFSVLDAVLLKPLPYDDPEQLVRVEETYEEWSGASEFVRAPVVAAMRGWDDVFTDVSTIYTYRETGRDLTGGDRPERVVASIVSAGYFETLGAEPLMGRTFTEDESFGPGEYGTGDPTPRIVLSHGLWTRRFGSDADIVGRTIQLDDVPVEVIGVMRPDFQDPIGSRSDLWTPQDLRLGGSNGWNNYYLTTLARLRPGLDLDGAQQRVDTRVSGVRSAEPESGPWGATLVPLQDHIVGPTRRSMLWILAGAVTLVLISASVNVGNLVFARSLDREREVALRSALGSQRGRIMRHLMIENVLLAAAGSGIGLVLGLAGVRALMTVAPDALPSAATPGLSPSVFLFAIAVMLAALILFALVPTLRLARVPPADALRAGGRGGTEGSGLRRVRSTLVVAQVAVALVLMIGAGLLIRSFSAMHSAPLGVTPADVLTFEVHLPPSRYPSGEDREALHQALQERVRSLPGVEAAGATSWLPVNGRYHIWGTPRRLDSDGEPLPGQSAGADVRIVSGEYFQAMGITLLRGQAPADVDPAGQDIVWVSQSVAERLFPEGDPIGGSVWAIGAQRRVVGVVSDVATDARGTQPPAVYTLHAQYADDRNWAMIHAVRVAGDTGAIQAAAEAALRALDPNLVLYRAQPFASVVARARAQDRFALLLMSAFAILALVLAVVGTYGVLSGNVARRGREIGIRMALGADAGLIRRSVLRSAAVTIGGGLALGGALAFVGSRWLDSLLFEVQPTDPGTYGLAVGTLVLLSLAASYLPARRATRIQPTESLAGE